MTNAGGQPLVERQVNLNFLCTLLLLYFCVIFGWALKLKTMNRTPGGS